MRALSGGIELFAGGLFALVSHESLLLDGRGPSDCIDTQAPPSGLPAVEQEKKKPSINGETLKDPTNETKNDGVSKGER